MRWLTYIHVDSDDALRRHCLDNVARPLTCHLVFIPLWSLSVRLRRSVHLALPHRCRWGAQWVLVVVERLWDVVVVGSSDAVEGGGRC